jgi:hypothetical protein
LHQERSNPGDNDGDAAIDMPDRRPWPEIATVETVAHLFDPIGFAVRVSREHGEETLAIGLAKALKTHNHYRDRLVLIVGPIP